MNLFYIWHSPSFDVSDSHSLCLPTCVNVAERVLPFIFEIFICSVEINGMLDVAKETSATSRCIQNTCRSFLTYLRFQFPSQISSGYFPNLENVWLARGWHLLLRHTFTEGNWHVCVWGGVWMWMNAPSKLCICILTRNVKRPEVE